MAKSMIARRGFASLTPERRRELAAMGGRKSRRGLSKKNRPASILDAWPSSASKQERR